MRLKLSLTLSLSLYKGEATRMRQLTIADHYSVPKYERKLACQCGIPSYKLKSLLSMYAPRAR